MCVCVCVYVCMYVCIYLFICLQTYHLKSTYGDGGCNFLFRVQLVRRVEKWEDRKYFNFPHFCLVRSGKVEGWKK